jgi:hypothetical protein
MKIVKPTWCELIALEPPLALIALAMRPAATDLKAYTLNAAPTWCPPWGTPPYTRAVYGGHARGGVRWCTSVYGRCTGGVRSSPSSAVVKPPTAICGAAPPALRRRPAIWGHAMSGIRCRRKGVRVELTIAKLSVARKFSRAYQAGNDLEPPLGADRMLRIECKARATGFVQLYDGRDVLIVKSDRREPLVVVRLSLAADIAKAGDEVA